MPKSGPTFGVSDGNDDQSIRLIAEDDPKRIAFQGAISAAAVSGWKSGGIFKYRVQYAVHRGSKSDCRTDITLRIPVKQLVEIDTGALEDTQSPLP